MQIAEQADYDVLVEMTPLNIFTGEPAITHIETAFARGRDVITANKGPIAWKFAKLRDMAAQNGCRFFYETTVMDGTPVFNFVEKTLQMAEVRQITSSKRWQRAKNTTKLFAKVRKSVSLRLIRRWISRATTQPQKSRRS